MSRYYYGSSTSSSESDTTICEKLEKGIQKKKKFPPPTLKRSKRQGMCMCSGDEKSSQELNIVRIDTDSDFDNLPENTLKGKASCNLVEFEDDIEFEKALLTIETQKNNDLKHVKKK